MKNEYLKLNEARCKDCYACIRACPVKAIGFANSQANIIADECVLCGNCYVTCPQNAKRIREDVPTVRDAIRSGKRVVASVDRLSPWPWKWTPSRTCAIRSKNSALPTRRRLPWRGAGFARL